MDHSKHEDGVAISNRLAHMQQSDHLFYVLIFVEVEVVCNASATVSDSSLAYLMFEAAWALKNIAFGTSKYKKVVTDLGAAPMFAKIFASPSDDVREQFFRSWDDIRGITIPASRHYKVAKVLVEEGMVIEAGTDLFILDILQEQEEPPKSYTRSTQSNTSQSLHSKAAAAHEDFDDSDSAPANKKQKVNDIGQTKQKTITTNCSGLVFEVMVKKGMEVKPSEPLYSLKLSSMIQDLSEDATDEMLLSTTK